MRSGGGGPPAFRFVELTFFGGSPKPARPLRSQRLRDVVFAAPGQGSPGNRNGNRKVAHVGPQRLQGAEKTSRCNGGRAECSTAGSTFGQLPKHWETRSTTCSTAGSPRDVGSKGNGHPSAHASGGENLGRRNLLGGPRIQWREKPAPGRRARGGARPGGKRAGKPPHARARKERKE